MAWIESHQSLKEHPKLYQFMELVKINKAQAIGHLHLLWYWCVDYAPDGVIRSNDAAICRAAEWSGDAKCLINALVDAGFLDRRDGVLTVHDWSEFRLHYDLMLERKEKQKEQTRERVQQWRATKRSSNAPVTKCNAHKDITKPNQPNQTNRFDDAFDCLWEQYPRRLGRKQALVAFRKTVKTDANLAEIETALKNFLILDYPTREPKYVPYGSTWFGNWQDWVHYTAPEPRRQLTKAQAANIESMKRLERRLNESGDVQEGDGDSLLRLPGQTD